MSLLLQLSQHLLQQHELPRRLNKCPTLISPTGKFGGLLKKKCRERGGGEGQETHSHILMTSRKLEAQIQAPHLCNYYSSQKSSPWPPSLAPALHSWLLLFPDSQAFHRPSSRIYHSSHRKEVRMVAALLKIHHDVQQRHLGPTTS